MTNESKCCPECGGKVIWSSSCHTWPSGERWMACMGCDSAIAYICTQCTWIFTHGLNPMNPSTEENEKKRPSWIEGPLQCTSDGFSVVVEGIDTEWPDD